MTAEIPWSWRAFAIAAFQAGVCLMVCLAAILAIREGSGTDLRLQIDRAGYLVASLVQCSLLGMAVLGIARWMANRARRTATTFVILAVALPVCLFLALAIWVLATTGIQGLPFLDPRRWLELPAFALTFYAAALTYLALAKARTSRKDA